MPKNNHVRNVNGLRSYAATKSKAVAQRIGFAIQILVGQNTQVNFNAVATLACVLKTTLYGNPDYRSHIEKLRQSSITAPSGTVKRTITDK